MYEREPLSSKERILVAMSAAMGAGCRTCARGLYSRADAAGASTDEIEWAFREGLLQRERATGLMREEAGALLGLTLTRGPGEPGEPAEGEPRLAHLAGLAASVAANAAPDGLKRARAASTGGATEVELRVAIGIGRSVRDRAGGFSDAEIDEALGADPSQSVESAANACAAGEGACSC